MSATTTPFKDVFISYGRKESLAFATKLFHKLEETGHPAWFDHVNIPKSDDFQQQIDDGIRSAHNFIFIIAPHANASEFCLKEIEMALSLGKRIIPILHVERDMWQINTEIRKRNWIYAREKEDTAKPLAEWEAMDDFEAAFAELTELLKKEKSYVEKHTEILWQALEWQQKQKQTQFLLVGKERQEAEEWLLTEFTPPKQPPCKPTDLHCQYICEARKNAENLMTDVFICYDTGDKDIRDKVIKSLSRHAITTWTHDQDIAQGREYARAIEVGIEQADNLLLFISPESLQSEYCQKEVRHALKMNKRVLPLLIRNIDDKDLSGFQNLTGLDISQLQYIDFTDNTEQADYDADIDQILNLLKKDQAYYEQHKILLARAIQWEKEGRKNTFLLRGYNLENAATWLQLNQKRAQHSPTAIHKTLIEASLAAKGSLGTEAFISYSRKDSDFARELNLKLQEAGKTTWFDQESISSGVDFEKEIFKGIDSADNIVFVLSPDSVESEYCEREVLYAANKNKRFVTVLHRATDPATMPEPLRVINWIDFTDTSSRAYDKAFAALIQAIELDQAHAHQHTILQQRATEWEESNQSPDFLLNASACANALTWQAQAKGKNPKTTELQQRFIASSQQAIEEAEAKERAVAASLKKRLQLARVAIVIAILLLGVAGYYIYESNRLYNHSQLLNERANLNRIQAEEQRDNAQQEK